MGGWIPFKNYSLSFQHAHFLQEKTNSKEKSLRISLSTPITLYAWIDNL